MDVVVFREIEVFGHGEPTTLVAGVLFETLHWTQVFPETVRKPSTGFANVQLVAALARDDIDYTSRSTVEPSL